MKRHPALVRLSWDHHHGLVMARRIQQELPGADAAGVARLYGDLVQLWAGGLLPHFRAEGECLLARLVRRVPQSDEVVQRTEADHLSLEAMMVDMRDADDSSVRHDGLARFGELLAAHIRWEEAVLFEATQQRLNAEELEALRAQLEAELPPLAPAPLA